MDLIKAVPSVDVFFSFCRWETTKTMVIPELVELTNDEENSVRLAGLETITNLLNLLDDGMYNTLVYQ